MFQPSSVIRKAIVALAVFGAILPSQAVAQSSKSSQLKAAIVFNILRFVDFPGSNEGGLTFCVSSRDPDASRFRAFSGRTAGSRQVSVRLLSSNSYAGCDVVYLGDANPSEIASASRRGTLVMGDGSRFINRGGAVGLVRTGSQVRFELNLKAANQSDIEMSSRLIRLASRITR